MYEELLKHRCDLVDNLDSEPLFDYLVQNGVLDPDIAGDIRNGNDGTEVNHALLKYLDSKGSYGTSHHALFINALRQTGHLQLANLLDVGVRIQPRRWNSLGYLNRSRHKGQICLILQVNAVEVRPDQFPVRRGISGTSYWISLADLKLFENIKLTPAPSLHTTTSQYLGGNALVQVEEEKSPKCLCACFGKMFGNRKRKGKTKDKMNVQLVYEVEPRLETVMEDSGQTVLKEKCSDKNQNRTLGVAGRQGTPTPSDSGVENSDRSNAGSDEFLLIDEMKMKADILRDKSNKFYQLLLEADTPLRNALLKYFEQVRGILVVDVMYEDGIIIRSICTKIDQLNSLETDFHNGRLVHELEEVLVNENVIKMLSVLALKLQLSAEEDEFPKAMRDLQS